MRVNVGRVINAKFTDVLTKTSTTSNGAFIDGVWKPGKAATAAFRGSVQPMGNHDFPMLQEGIRDHESIVIYSRERLTGDIEGSKKGGDIINWRGYDWRVVAVEEWQHGGYFKAAAVRLGLTR